MAKDDITQTEIEESPAPETTGADIITLGVPKDVKPNANPPDKTPTETDGIPEGFYISSKGKMRRKRRTPEQIASDDATGKILPKAPRVKGTKTVSEVMDESSVGIDATVLANVTEGIHVLLGELIDPACKLSHAQAMVEGEAIARVMEQYNIDPNSKSMGIIVLVGTIALCEVPTIMAVSAKLKRTINRSSQIVGVPEMQEQEQIL